MFSDGDTAAVISGLIDWHAFIAGGGDCLPASFHEGNPTHFREGLSGALRDLIDQGTVLSDAMALFTSNVAHALKPHRTGRRKAGVGADPVVLDENLAVRHEMAPGGMACPRWPGSPTRHV